MKMLPHTDCRLGQSQRGAVLLVLAVVMTVIALGVLYGGMDARQHAGAVTAQALAKARAALIGRALTDPNHPGSLPCPDTNNDGTAELMNGPQCPSYIGHLPWRTLGLGDIRDGSGERLWYALSSDDQDARAVNSLATVGLLQINGNGHFVAVLLAPGLAIGSQQRGTPTQQTTPDNYLEGGNEVVGTATYVTKTVADPAFNDTVLTLSSADLFRKVERLVLQQIADSLRLYAAQNKNAYPFAAADQFGDEQTGLLAGLIPFNTLGFSSSSALAVNGWFNDLTSGSASPYIVSSGQDYVQINLKYCSGSMDVSSAVMAVHCV